MKTDPYFLAGTLAFYIQVKINDSSELILCGTAVYSDKPGTFMV